MARPIPPWKELPGEFLAEIAGHLPCLVDLVSMSMAWGKVIAPPLQSPRLLPWLLLPYRRSKFLPAHRPDMERRAECYCLAHSDIHRIRVGHDTGGALYFGSYDGGWLFIAQGQHRGHALLNIYSDRRIPLADTVSWAAVGGEPNGDPHPGPRPMLILAATLSCSPVAPGTRCIAAAIVDLVGADEFANNFAVVPQIAFWRVEAGIRGHQVGPATGYIRYSSGHAPVSLEDILHHRGVFLFLTTEENLLCVREDHALEMRDDTRVVDVVFKPRPLNEPLEGRSERVIGRYLVESRGQILMVVRIASVEFFWEEDQTCVFEVFEQHKVAAAGGIELCTCKQMQVLDGRMLFVARGSSRSFETAGFPGSRREGIYFLDEPAFIRRRSVQYKAVGTATISVMTMALGLRRSMMLVATSGVGFRTEHPRIILRLSGLLLEIEIDGYK